MKKIILAVLVIITFLLTWQIVDSRQKTSLYAVTSGGTLDVASVRKAFDRYLIRAGGEKTYEAFKIVYRGKSVGDRHAAAHLFGEELFKHDGVKGISVCDNDFSFGCFHGFFGKVVGQLGTYGASELDQVCVEKFGKYGLGCVHGIGHGLGEYLGPGKLDQQLSICDNLTWKGRYFGCKEGVFMEYNMPASGASTSEALTMRPYNPSMPYYPCPSVATQFQPACYMELSNWWEEVFHKDYTKIGALCAAIENEDNKEACFIGIGYSEGPKDGYNSEKTSRECARMPDADGELLCRAGASWSFSGDPKYRKIAENLCVFSTPEKTEMCRKKADLLSY